MIENNIEISSDSTIPVRENIIARAISRWMQFPRLIQLVTAAMLFAVLGLGLYFSLVQNAQIAYIAPPSPVTPPYSSPSPIPFPSGANCVSQVYSAEISHSCSTQGFYNVKYQCADGRTFTLGGGGKCIDLMSAANQSRNDCGEICQVSIPSPKPSATPLSTWPPTPPPTSDPTPLVSCVTETYKIPSGIDITKLNLTSFDQYQQYKVIDSSITAKVGERYVFNMLLTNIRGYNIDGGSLGVRAWTENTLSSSAPYTVLGAGSQCTLGYPDKSIRCFLSSLPLKNKQQVRPNTYQVVQIDNVAQKSTTTLTYKGIFAATPFKCSDVSITVMPSNTAPSPTPLPSPSITPGCLDLFGRTICWPGAKPPIDE